jgi:hypothetical protein
LAGQTQASSTLATSAFSPSSLPVVTPAADISAAVVKDLRNKTGAGMMDCKKALAENDGDLEKATEVCL